MQTASTWEIGTQQNYNNINWEVSYYYSKVKDELISVVGDFAVNGKTINYQGNTLHQGIELAINTTHQGIFSSNDKMMTKLIYKLQ